MADNKKYYYMRLKENFFDSEEIKVLESMPNGYKYSNILLKLYLKSLKNDGELRLNEYIPYNATMVAAITGHDVDTVRIALEVFKKLKLVEVLDNGTIYMLGIQSYIGKTSTEADRVRLYRDKIEKEKKQLKAPNVQNQYKCTPEIELEKEIELDIKKETTTTTSSDSKKILNHFESCGFGLLSPVLIEKILADVEIYGEDWVIEAATIADENGAHRYSYVKGILENWKAKGKSNTKEVKHGSSRNASSTKENTPKEETEGEKLVKRAKEKYGDLGDTTCDF